MSLGDEGREAHEPTPQGRFASLNATQPDRELGAVPPAANDGMLIVDRSGKVAPLTRQADVVWRVPHGGRSIPLNQRFAQMWELPGRVVNRLVAESNLRGALRREELEVFFQPQASLATGEIDGVEALIRWRHPGRGIIMPDSFIPLAEQTGLILSLGDWVLRAACAQNADWIRAGMRPLRMAVNISARQLDQPGLPDIVERVLSETGLASKWLELEVTETATMRDPVKSIKALNDLRDLGLRISMDDFGTGYSSLAHVKDLPLDTLKIDRSLISGVTKSRSHAAIAIAIVAMANGMDLEVVAEGVETPGQLAFVKDIRCHRYQGFLLGRPEPASQLSSVLELQSSERAA
ncbi:MAG: EAL domain-containing protein [Chloroflexi bacterium]|nr:EAL domain-containing protein [Chloroflexota bacterium]